MELRLREIGAGVAGKVCTAYLSCSETTTVLFQCVRQGDSRSWAMSISGGLVMATSVRGQSHWWEALLSSLQDSLQLHLQSSCPESWPAVIQAQQVFLWLSEQSNLEILQWMKRWCTGASSLFSAIALEKNQIFEMDFSLVHSNPNQSHLIICPGHRVSVKLW